MQTALRIFCFALVLHITAASAWTQPVDTAWTRNFWNGSFDSINWVSQTSDGGFILTGSTREPGVSQSDINLIKTDSTGIQDWSTTIGDVESDCGFHVLETIDGGYLISASSYAFGDGGGAPWIVKTNSIGDTLWTYPFAPEGRNGFPLYAIQTLDSGFAITGRVNLSTYYNDAFILLLDRDGNFVDYQHYGGDADLQDGWFITQMPDSGFIVAGNDNNYYTTQYDFWAFRTNKALEVVWDSSYAITSWHDEVNGACKVDDGIVMVGLARAYGYALKIDFEGNTLWSKNISYYFTGESNSSVCPTEDGGYMVGGWVGVTGHRRDFSFIKLNPEGDAQWQFTVGGTEDDHGEAIVATSDGGFVMTGTSYSFVNGTSSYLAKIFDSANTTIGSDVEVPASDSVTIIFEEVYFTGATSVEVLSEGPLPPATFTTVPAEPPRYYNITSTADIGGTIEICISYDPGDISGEESELTLWHFDGADWEDITSSRDEVNHIICGVAVSLSPFIIAQPSGMGVTDEGGNIEPHVLNLFQNYPNPFNLSTMIRFDLPRQSHVSITVYNLLGQELVRLADQEFSAGSHSIPWDGMTSDGSEAATGIYVYRLVTDDYTLNRRMVLLK